MSGEREHKPRRGGDFLRWGAKLAALFGLWALSTFTVQGFLAALYLAPTEDGLWWPMGTRVVWWVLFYGLGSAWVQRLMWREAKYPIKSHLLLWAASHVNFAVRLARRVAWWKAGIATVFEQRRRARPEPLAATAPDVSRTVSDAVPAAA